jgi:hypothetical protein
MKVAGADGLIYLSTTGTGAPVLAGGFRAFTVDNSREAIDTTEFGATNKTEVQGFPSSNGTFEGFWLSDDSTMRDAANSLDGANMALYPWRGAMSKYFGGPVWIDYSLRTAVDQAVTITGSWRSRGNMSNNL